MIIKGYKLYGIVFCGVRGFGEWVFLEEYSLEMIQRTRQRTFPSVKKTKKRLLMNRERVTRDSWLVRWVSSRLASSRRGHNKSSWLLSRVGGEVHLFEKGSFGRYRLISSTRRLAGCSYSANIWHSFTNGSVAEALTMPKQLKIDLPVTNTSERRPDRAVGRSLLVALGLKRTSNIIIASVSTFGTSLSLSLTQFWRKKMKLL